MVGGLREKDYQLAAQKRNEAWRRFDYNCQAAKYFERESRLAEHFNSWISRDVSVDKNYAKIKTKAEKLERRKSRLKKLLKDEEAGYRIEIERSIAAVRRGKNRKSSCDESLEDLKKKLATKRAERGLYYQNYSGPNRSDPISDSLVNFPTRSQIERRIDASRNFQATTNMEDTNLRNNTTDKLEWRMDNPGNRHHGERRHLQGHSLHSSSINIGGDLPDKPTPNIHGERRHYESSYDLIYEGGSSPPHPPQQEADNASNSSGAGSRDGQDGWGHAAISERRHYGNTSAGSAKSLANTNMRDVPVEEIAEGERSEEEFEAEAENGEPKKGEEDAVDEEQNSRKSPDDKSSSRYFDEPDTTSATFLTHNELINQIQDLINRELHACKKQNWSEALRLRDMRNRFELRREIDIFGRRDLNLDDETRQREFEKINERIKLMNKREASGNPQLVYSEEARILYQSRVREDENILKKINQDERETLLKDLEKEWETFTLSDKKRIAESPVKLNKSYFQEELELTASAMEKAVEEPPPVHASNEESKNSCIRNRNKAASSLIFLG